ncbi:P44/Msp2 family outer membrane protein [Anaplasma capra]|uniref:P44/Msp2 family outer membrane protein n=1 Tax=Anaplasma capra TaxID=1562740 RepID=UPI0021D5F341|nr:P44/Msp2 family outer membrane protein [Anaplasma capra]MCU7612728.1 P44/Msp2 family outer membrane protein [Anaplasma capra]
MSHRSLFAVPCLICAAMSTTGSAATPGSRSVVAAPYNTGGGTLYVATQYKPAIPMVRGFTMRESSIAPPSRLFGLKPSASVQAAEHVGAGVSAPLLEALRSAQNLSSNHVPSYESSLYGVSGIVGYAKMGARVELEVTFEEFKAKKLGQSALKEGHEYLIMARDVGNSSPGGSYAVFRNRAISAGSAVVSVCQDFLPVGAPGSTAPYACLGGGAEFLDILGVENTRFTYQIKAGTTFNLHPRVGVFAAGYYRGTVERAFKPSPVVMVTNTSTASSGEQRSQSLSFVQPEGSAGVRYAGVEVGVRVSL